MAKPRFTFEVSIQPNTRGGLNVTVRGLDHKTGAVVETDTGALFDSHVPYAVIGAIGDQFRQFKYEGADTLKDAWDSLKIKRPKP